MTKPDGCTSVEEWLDKGGTITRRRPGDPEEVEPVTVDGVRFEFVPDDSSPAPFRCRLTGTYGHRGSVLNRYSTTRPYRCHKSCGSFGTLFRHGWYWCEDHAPEGAS